MLLEINGEAEDRRSPGACTQDASWAGEGQSLTLASTLGSGQCHPELHLVSSSNRNQGKQ